MFHLSLIMCRWLIILASGLASLTSASQAPGEAVAPSLAPPPDPPLQPAGPIRDDGAIHDSIGFVTVRPVPDAPEETPPFFRRVDYLRQHHDPILAAAYLRQIVSNARISSASRARAILELADCLACAHEEGESLCWLKIWMELYPARPEIGAVAYRIGAMYTQMGLPDLARDAYYLALAHTINEGQVQNADDLKRYTELTVGTLWGLATNEYQSGQWARAAELFARYRQECPTASSISLEKAAFLQADCAYQLKQADKAASLYEAALQQHPFNPLAPEARLRLYHLYVLKNAPELAREDLQALAWTVRTVWPQDETYWQKQTAELLLALNQKNASVLPPLVQGSSRLPPEGKSWQEALNHYDALVSCEAPTANASVDSPVAAKDKADAGRGLPEEADLLAMDRSLNQLLPAPRTASTP
jgi:outer membrane protein assembly factor BamD (BamD/ComL family)